MAGRLLSAQTGHNGPDADVHGLLMTQRSPVTSLPSGWRLPDFHVLKRSLGYSNPRTLPIPHDDADQSAYRVHL
jgi:hypothetical protein